MTKTANQLLLTLCLSCIFFLANGQELKLKKGKTQIYVEEYSVLSSNKKIRQGAYKKYKTDGSQIWMGKLENNAKVGEWNYFENGELVQTYDFNENIYKYHGQSDQASFVMVNGEVEVLKLDSPPSYIGSKIGLTDELNRVLDYPMQARRMGIEGAVRVDIWINADGSLGEITLVSGIMKECDEDLVTALKNIQPLWIPGTSSGSNVKSKLALAVDYQLAYVFEDLAVTVR